MQIKKIAFKKVERIGFSLLVVLTAFMTALQAGAPLLSYLGIC